MKVQTAVAKILKMEGVEFVTCFPTVTLHEDLAEEGIRVILFRNENVAAQAADGFTRASFGKRIGVVSMESAPGVHVAYAGIREAFSDSVPMLILASSDIGRRRLTTDPFWDPIANCRSITKWADSVNFADRTCEIMRRAFTYLRIGRPRPVLVDVPIDVAGEEFDDALFQYKPVKVAKAAGDLADVKEAVKMLLAAKNPVVRAGQGVLYAQAWAELRELVELLQIPVTSTQNGKSAFAENHPLYLGAGARGHPATVEHFLDKADVVLAVGSSCTEEAFTYSIPDGKVLIQVTIDERDINKDYPVEQAIIGDARLVLGQLIDEVKKQIGPKGRQPNDALVKEIATGKEEWLKKWLPKLTSNDVPMNPMRVYWDLMAALDRKETIITHDSGTPRDSLTAFWEAPVPGGYIGYGKDHLLGSGMGLAMGAKLARPDKTVVHVGGDGAFGQTGMDWETSVRASIPIINIVLNNGTLGWNKMVNPKAAKLYNLNRMTGDYTKIAEGQGSYAERVEQPGDIIPAILRAKKVTDSGKPALIEFMTKEEIEAPVIWAESLKKAFGLQ
jgi:acetolactate synthase-1/2/3 large subunit